VNAKFFEGGEGFNSLWNSFEEFTIRNLEILERREALKFLRNNL